MSKHKGESMADIFAEEEERRLAETRRELAAEKAAYDALSPEEKAALEAKREAYWAELEEACERAEAEEPEEDDEDEEPED